jgi:predicted Zn-dependent protease
MSERIDAMKQFIQQFPDNPFPRYALALELKNAGRADEAIEAFQALLAKFPAYVAGYQHFGMVLSEAGRTSEARQVLTTGLEAARSTRNGHAASEIEGLLRELDD